MSDLPAAAGFRMPAEWTPQDVIWLSWPLKPGAWPDCRAAAEQAYAEFAAAISRFEAVCINCAQTAQQGAGEALVRAGARLDRIEFFDHPTNDTWCRDHGPVFVQQRDTGEVAITDWGFNAWGGKFPAWDLDQAIPARIAAALGLRRFAIPLVAEGGGLEVNGEGVLLTTESVLLNPNRNPGLTQTQVEILLRGALGVEAICWLKSGLECDDTDGHIDTLARFVAPTAVVTVVSTDPNDPNRVALERNRADLARFRLPDGQRLDLVPLPQPDAIRLPGWRLEVLPATYANFLILNGAVLVPTYRQPAHDRQALRTLAQCFPDREVIGLDCRDLVLEGGALHCLSQQQPANPKRPPGACNRRFAAVRGGVPGR
jgi:agmatine deiminase